MADTRGLNYGWFFLRLCAGLHFLQIGAARFNLNRLELYAVAALLCGFALVVGLLVRPSVLLMMVLMITIFISGSRLEFRLVRESLTELLALLGFLIGGGGSFLALGAAINGLNGKWYQ